MAGWHFLIVPLAQSQEITKKYGSKKRGWGSLPVRVTLGASQWDTSIFPDAQSGRYLLPLKASIRKKEDVWEKDTISFSITIQEK